MKSNDTNPLHGIGISDSGNKSQSTDSEIKKSVEPSTTTEEDHTQLGDRSRISFRIGKKRKVVRSRKLASFPSKQPLEKEDGEFRVNHKNGVSWKDIANRLIIKRINHQNYLPNKDVSSTTTTSEKFKSNNEETGKLSDKTLLQLEPSLIVFLYTDAYVCRNLSSTKSEGNAQPYNRSSRHFLQSIDMGLIPYDLANQTPCKFYDGYIIVELFDFRQTVAVFPTSSASLPKKFDVISSELAPKCRRILLRPTAEMISHNLDELAKTESLKNLESKSPFEPSYPLNVLIETRLLTSMYPNEHLCLCPTVDVLKLSSMLNLNNFKIENARSCQEHRYRYFERTCESTSHNYTSKPLQSSKRKRSLSGASDELGNTIDISTKKKKISPKYSNNTKNSTFLSTTSNKKSLLGKNSIDDYNALSDSSNLKSNMQDMKKIPGESWGKGDSIMRKGVSGSWNSDYSYFRRDSSLFYSSQSWNIKKPPIFGYFQSEVPLSDAWVKAVENFHKKLEATEKANFEVLTASQPPSNSGMGRLGSVMHLANRLGKLRWPTETIAVLKSRPSNHQRRSGLVALKASSSENIGPLKYSGV